VCSSDLDWQLNRNLTFNLGVRWDIETNPLNNDYETPAAVRAAVTELATQVAAMNGPDFFRVENYLTDGSQREIFLGEIQPRLGLSYDVLGDQRLVAFAGAGRYYDRTLFNTGLDERYRLQYGVRKFRFSKDGAMRDGQTTIAWDDAYLSREGLQNLIDSGVAPNPEIFLLENDTRPLHTDQYSFGVRGVILSAPLPCCNSTKPTTPAATSTWTIQSTNSMIFIPRGRWPGTHPRPARRRRSGRRRYPAGRAVPWRWRPSCCRRIE
jgi:hypothetical protein